MLKIKRDKPISAFDKYGLFKTDNWNDRICVRIRSALSDFPEKHRIKDGINIHRFWFNDQTYFVIMDDDSENLFFITWYKDRGKTENFLCFGRPATKAEAISLAKRLEKLKW